MTEGQAESNSSTPNGSKDLGLRGTVFSGY